MHQPWRDRQFRAAFFVPLLLLLVARLYFWTAFAPWNWPLQEPRRFGGVVLLWPLMEEVFFRGLLQPVLAGLAWGRWRWCGLTAANVAVSLLFAAAHLFSHPPLWATLVFFPSLVFGYFRDRHDSLLSPIFLHVGYNLGYYWFFGG